MASLFTSFYKIGNLLYIFILIVIILLNQLDQAYKNIPP